jgi:hypothetical protein
MNERELAELLKYSSPKELYIVTWFNELVLLKCPFEVIAEVDVGRLKKGEVVMVDEVKVTYELITVFVIGGNAYLYYYLSILIQEPF